jgi:kynurenine 3-monooxygenase
LQPIVVVGGGLIGCLLAICLARRGFRVTIYEKNADLRSTTEDGRRPSINLTLCRRGLSSLERAGAFDILKSLLTPVYGRVVHQNAGALTYQAYGEEGDAIYSIKRKELNSALVGLAEEIGVRFVFRRRCVDVDVAPDSVRLKFENADGVAESITAGCVFAADGSLSAIRSRLHELHRINQSVEVSPTGYKTLTIRAHSHLQPGAIHVWARQESMAIAFPNRDSSHSVAFHLPLEGSGSFHQLKDTSTLHHLVSTCFADLAPLVRDCEQELLAQRPNSMQSVRCSPWHFDGTLLLMGDAAHAILPHYGQGANAGFEDCRILADLIDQHGADWPIVFSRYEETRRPDTEAIFGLCSEHAHELHYSVGTPDFDLRLRLEKRLHRLFPRRILPLYSMIAFSEMPFAEVRARERIQRRVIGDLLPVPDIENRIEEEQLLRLVQDRIERELPTIAND